MVIDMANNSIKMFGQKMEMVNVASGHSAINTEPYDLAEVGEF